MSRRLGLGGGLAPACVAAVLLTLGACGPSQPPAADLPPARRLVLVTLDTTRADRIGAYGHQQARTPVIDRLADEGWLFETARAAVPVTLPSHASLLTGVYPSAHGIQDNAVFTLRDDATTVAEVLASHGVRTGAFVGSLVLDSRFGLDQGFETYRGPPAATLGSSMGLVERPAEKVIDDALAWLGTLAPTDPVFLWVHLFDPHHRYEPPARFRQLLEDPYDGEIAYCDEQIGRLLGEIERLGLGDDLAVIVTADHGEALGEHGERTHGVFVYDATIRVPLIIRPASAAGDRARQELPRKVSTPVSNVAIAPTILELFGIEPTTLPAAHLPSLGSLLSASEDVEVAPIYMESFLPYHSYGWHPLRGIVWNGFKFIEGVEPELYDLTADPGERVDLAAGRPDLCARMRDRLAQLLSSNGPLGWQDDRVLDPGESRAMEALGYVGAAARQPVSLAERDLPDPRDRIGDLERRDELLKHMMEGVKQLQSAGRGPGSQAARARAMASLARAREMIDGLREDNPADPSLDATLGAIETFRGRPSEAVPALERAVLHQPTIANNHYNLAVCYRQLGHDDWAVREMRKALSCEPGFLRAYDWLAFHHAKTGNYGRAVWWLQRQQEQMRGNSEGLGARRARIERLLRQAQAAGQQVTPPAEFPVEDLLPEGRRGESTSDGR